MQERAGLEVKYLAYTSLNALKSAISAKKQVVLITSRSQNPLQPIQHQCFCILVQFALRYRLQQWNQF